MNCPHCGSAQTRERPGLTELGYRRFHCRDCGRRFNERTGTPYNWLQINIIHGVKGWFDRRSRIDGAFLNEDIIDELDQAQVEFTCRSSLLIRALESRHKVRLPRATRSGDAVHRRAATRAPWRCATVVA